MSFDAVEKYNTRLLIPRETGMFATVAVLSNGRQKDDTKEHVQRDSPLTSCVLYPKHVLDCLHVRGTQRPFSGKYLFGAL